jgi:hypothetical protein
LDARPQIIEPARIHPRNQRRLRFKIGEDCLTSPETSPMARYRLTRLWIGHNSDFGCAIVQPHSTEIQKHAVTQPGEYEAVLAVDEEVNSQ